MEEQLTNYDFKSEHNYYFDISFIDNREIDRIEETKIRNFISKGCYCSKGYNKTRCSKNSQFIKQIVDHRINISDLDKKSQDFVILGLISAGFKRDFNKNYCEFRFNGNIICKNTFLFMNNISATRYKNLLKHYISNNISERVHKNKGKNPAKAYSFKIKEKCQFYRKCCKFKRISDSW